MRSLLFLLVAAASVFAETYFKEEFLDDTWEERWVQSKHKDDYGKFILTAGKFYSDPVQDKGIKTSQDAKFYDVAAKFPKFSNDKKTLVIQFTVKHEQGIDCGGGYLKLLPSTVDLEDFHGESPYNVMFGPDICGYNKKVHVILSYKGKNHLIKKELRCKDDELTHLYTLILKSDNTYEVQIDGEKIADGKLEEDWDLLAPKKIKDPTAEKPKDWDDRKFIDDVNDKKPDDWEKPEHITDPDAKKPEDWDDEMDGEWEAPMIPNPEYKGEWKPKQIDNPAYKGEWVHPEIDNPEYEPNDKLYLYEDFGAVAIDLWQVKSGSIFDNIIITDSIEEAKDFAEKTFYKLRDTEKKLKKDEEDEERKKNEEKFKKEEEEEEKKKKEKGEDDDEDDDEEVKEKKADPSIITDYTDEKDLSEKVGKMLKDHDEKTKRKEKEKKIKEEKKEKDEL